MNDTDVFAVVKDWNAPKLTTKSEDSVFENEMFRRSGTMIFTFKELREFELGVHDISRNSKDRNVTGPIDTNAEKEKHCCAYDALQRGRPTTVAEIGFWGKTFVEMERDDGMLSFIFKEEGSNAAKLHIGLMTEKVIDPEETVTEEGLLKDNSTNALPNNAEEPTTNKMLELERMVQNEAKFPPSLILQL